ncbi:MAG: LPXTG cell wall anchor domain-containing protein [Lactobacillus sp.]|nr:LPXTG cell wall anchor domain-containing protein [Lactobacillus sp.]
MPNGEVVDHNGNVVGYVDANGKIHHTLPQTGESNNENVAAAVLGGTAVALGFIGLTGVKRRHTN